MTEHINPKIEVRSGCPLCSGIVRGNDDLGWLCPKCFVVFGKRHFGKVI